jgi:alkylhydroperoxidase family enzyme
MKRHPDPGQIWNRMMEAMRSRGGSIEPGRRAAIVAHLVEGAETALAAPVVAFIEKVATASHRVTENDLQTLRAEKLSDGAILELTLTAAAASAHVGVLAVRKALAEPVEPAEEGSQHASP